MKWKKSLPFLLVILCILLLNQCSARKLTFRGQVLAVQENGGYPAFWLRVNDGQKLLLLTDERTFLHSWLEGTDAAELAKGSLTETEIQVYITSRPTRTRLDGKTYKSYLADQIILLSALERNAYILSDGTELNLRRHADRTVYQHPDGTALLAETRPIGPDRVSVGSLLSMDDLNVEAQETILSWYESRGLLYNLDDCIEKAYLAFLAAENKEDFQSHYVEQSIFPNAYNDELIWFATTLQATFDADTGVEQRSCAAFRRDTGEFVPLSELFSCPGAEIGNLILDAADTVQADLPEMKKAFQTAYLVFHADALEIWFPAGSLKNHEYTCIVSAEYEDLSHVLQPWAVPVPMDNNVY